MEQIMGNVKGAAKKEYDNKTIESLLAKMEQMEQALQEKEQTIANLASKIKPTSRKKVKYQIVEYLDSVHSELGLNKKGQLVPDSNKDGLPARGVKSVLSYLYGDGERQPKYHKPIDTAAYQMAFLDDIRDWLKSEPIKPLIIELLASESVVAFTSEDIKPSEHVVLNAETGEYIAVEE